LQKCATCRHFTAGGRCDRYSFKADTQYTCDGWRPDIEALRGARTKGGKPDWDAKPGQPIVGNLTRAASGQFASVSQASAGGASPAKRKPAQGEKKPDKKKKPRQAASLKPGDKYDSIKNPHIYEALLRKGYSKEQAARIGNSMVATKDADFDKASTQLNTAFVQMHKTK
jgi:hypothetical protein